MYTKEKFIQDAAAKHNNKYDYSQVQYKNKITPVIIGCPIHGPFSRTPAEHLRGYQCVACGKEARSAATTKRNNSTLITWKDRIIEFRQIHGDLYTYAEQHNGNCHSKIIIICNIHGEFSKHMFAHINGSGCPTCQTESTKKYIKQLIPHNERSLTASNNRTTANKKRIIDKDKMSQSFYVAHGNKFIYDWSSYVGKSKKIRIVCEMHGEFYQTCVEHLLSAHGCPTCAISAKSKKQEDWLDIHDICIRQHRIFCGNKLIIVDGFNASTNTVYEFLGDYWHGHPRWYNKCNGVNPTNKILFVELFKITEDRLTLLHNMQYNIVYVWENDDWLTYTTTRLFNGTLES